MLANVNLGKDLEVLAPGGRVVIIGNRGEGNQGTVEINPRLTMMRDSSIMGMSLVNVAGPDSARIHAALVAGLANGSLRPVVGQEMPLAEAARAHHEVIESRAYGKIVLVVYSGFLKRISFIHCVRERPSDCHSRVGGNPVLGRGSRFLPAQE